MSSYSAVIHYLCAIVGLSYDQNKPLSINVDEIKQQAKIERQRVEFPFGKHSNPIRFKGTKVELFAPSITVDYAFPAMVSKTDDNGATVWLSWMNYAGKKIGPYKMHEDDDIKVISLNDNERRVNLDTVQISRGTVHTRQIKHSDESTHISHITPLDRLSKYLRRAGISHVLKNDRITFLYEYYYIEFDESVSKFELSSERSGVLVVVPNNKLGIEALVKRIEKIERNFNAEKLLARD